MTGADYDTPDVPWTMYYSGGFAIHGAYWHNNFGTPVSHGCVNLRVPEAKALYEWAPMGTEVVVTP
jgi:lipoprotein-anchoring transpeptidase ErfK/SrfK